MKLYVAGFGLAGNGYPNASRTVALLRDVADLEVVDCGGWLPEDLHLWKLATMPRWHALRWMLVLVFGNLRSVLRVLVLARSVSGVVYVPYPGVFFLFWASLLPGRWRPQCVVDGYISIWDSAFRDRTVVKQRSFAARVAKWVESRALRSAAMVLVDTEANREVFITEFGLEVAKVRSLPLAIDEAPFTIARVSPVERDATSVRVLFVGTLIPLHGIDVILDALGRLAGDVRFEFRLLGDGQQADLVASFMSAHPSARVTWLRDWCTLDQIAAEIAAANICLGVFGGGGKAARVLPFKLYMYLAAGRAIISQSLLSTPEGVPYPPIETVAQHQGAALAAAIQRIADDPVRRESMERDAAAYYHRWLSNARVVDGWQEMLWQLHSS